MDETALPDFVGRSPAMRAVRDLVHRIARADVTTLIQGETGTGKELVARAIHYLGRRKGHPFVPVNCGAVPDGLFENEFFGHARGAFTDARMAQPGLVAAAEGGTLFLDEIEALSPKGQVTLLRFLQDRTYRRLGESRPSAANVRIVAASNVNIPGLVKSGQFRQDLMYRLRVVSVVIPPLRDRREDILDLVDHFLDQFARLYDSAAKRLTAASIELMMSHPWPGNVRELETVIHQQFVLTDGPVLRLEPSDLELDGSPANTTDFPADSESPLDFREAKAQALGRFERDYLSRLLTASRGNVSAAARRCGKERRSFGKLLKKHGIDRNSYQ